MRSMMAPLPQVRLPGQLAEEPLLLLETPPAGIVALDHSVQRRVETVLPRDAGREHVEELGLGAALHERRPVEDLKVDLEADLLELLLGDESGLVHERVLLRGHPADRLARVARFLEEPPGLVLVLLVVGG